MALFGRRTTQADDVRSVDPSFPWFTTDEATRVRGLVQRTFAEHGIEMSVHPVVAVDAYGREFPLGPVMTACHAEERGHGAWAQVVREHVTSALAAESEAAPDPFAGVEAELVREHVLPRVVHAHDLPPGVGYAREVAPGLLEVLAVDTPEVSGILGDEHVERFGPLDDLRETAATRLAAVVPQRHPVERDGGLIDIVTTSTGSAASLALRLPGLAADHLGAPADPQLGVFFAVPFAGQLDVHVLKDDTARASLAQLALFAATGFDDGERPISPDVFWWHDGRVDRITHVATGGVALDGGPELAAVLQRLASPPAPGDPPAPGTPPTA